MGGREALSKWIQSRIPTPVNRPDKWVRVKLNARHPDPDMHEKGAREVRIDLKGVRRPDSYAPGAREVRLKLNTRPPKDRTRIK